MESPMDVEHAMLKSASSAALAAERVELGDKVRPVFMSWDEFGTSYKLIAVPFGSAFSEMPRGALGAGERSCLVTLWVGKTGRTALINHSGEHLASGYVAQLFSIAGEDLAAVTPKLRALLCRP